MPRSNRKDIISNYLHIMVQGINKEKIFETKNEKNMYLKYLEEASNKLNIRILVYAILDNHAHFLVYYEQIESISKFMNIANSKFAKFYNAQRNRVGYVYRDRFKSVQVENKKQLYNTIAYIHYNPIKAKIVEHLEDYKFSSYSQFINNKKSKQDILLLFGTYQYKEIFEYIHKNRDDILRMRGMEYIEENYDKVIKEYLDEKGICSVEDLKKQRDQLINMIYELRNKSNLKDNQICKILGLGKNRIYMMLNRKGR